MKRNKKKNVAAKHFNELAPLMFFENYICFKNEHGETIYWDNMFRTFTKIESRVYFEHDALAAHDYYRDDEMIFHMFLAYEFLSMIEAEHITLNVITHEN